MKTAVITDSNSGIMPEEGEKMGVFVLPMPVLVDEKEYFEGVNLTHDEFYRQMEAGADITTSQPSPESSAAPSGPASAKLPPRR